MNNPEATMEYINGLKNDSVSQVRQNLQDKTDSIIILAGGDNSRWNGVKKYEQLVNGEPVLSRTVRLCKEFHPTAALHVIGPLIKGKSHQDVFLKVYEKGLWSKTGNTFLMFGDVSWMRGTLKRFLSERPTEPKIYGRPHGNTITGRPPKELFGGVVPATWKDFMWKVHFDAFTVVPTGDWWTVAEMMIYDEKTRTKLTVLPGRFRDWTWFHVLRKREVFFRSRFFVDIGESVTDDFDYPEDYEPYCRLCGPLLEKETI